MAEREGCEVMARPSKGSGARSVIANVRLTPQEVGRLTEKFGSPGKGLRWMVDDWLRMEPMPTRRASGGKGGAVVAEGSPDYVVPASVEAMRNPQEVAALDEHYVPLANPVLMDDSPEPHRHRRGAVIRVDYIYGTPKQIYGCLVCGEELA